MPHSASRPTIDELLTALSPGLLTKLRRVRLVAMDVDGTLTDGGVHVGAEGEGPKRYSAQDGLGITLARLAGVRLAFITSRDSPVVARRAAELQIDDLFLKCWDKPTALRELADKYGLTPAQVAFVGDDLNDAAAFRCVGLGVAVANASTEAQSEADLVTTRAGGNGALRETLELVLRAQDRWTEAVAQLGQERPA